MILIRTLLAIYILILSVTNAYAQESEKTRIYEIRSNIPVIPVNVRGEKLYNDNRFYVPKFQSEFAFIRLRKAPDSNKGQDSILVRFLTWKKNTTLQQKYNAPVSTSVSGFNSDINQAGVDSVEKYFLISKNDLDSNCIKVYKRLFNSLVFTVGATTMPLKIRYSQNFDFQSTISLGTTAGVKTRISKYNPNYINILAGGSISTVSLDSFSTEGRISGQPLTNIAVFSPSVGIVLEFGKAQFGIFHGWDLLSKATQSKYNWIYNGKPWLSIGFGISLFTTDSKANVSGNQTQSNDRTEKQLKTESKTSNNKT